MPSQRVAANASDPTVDGPFLAWHEPGAQGILVNGETSTRVAGTHPAVGGDRLAVLGDGVINVTQTAGEPFATSVSAPGADAVAVSRGWVAWRVREGSRDAIYAQRLAGGEPVLVRRGAQLGRPAMEGDKVAFHVAGGSAGRIVVADLSSRRVRTVRKERRAQLLNPSIRGNRLLYVRARFSRQELRVGPLSRRAPRRDRRLWSTAPTGRRDSGHEPGVSHHQHGHPHRLWRRPRQGVAATLWTTALGADVAYVTRLRQEAGRPVVAELLRVPR
jgi:hypothetical protein